MNTLIGPLGLRDQFGTNIGYYDLVYDTGPLDMLANVAGMLASFIYQFLTLPATGLGIWLTDIATKPQRLFAPLEDFYERLLSPIFDIVPFPAVAVLAVSVLFLYISFEKKATETNLRRDAERVIIGLALAVVAVVLARNPFTPMRVGFEMVQSVASDLVGGTNSGQITVDTFLAPMTQIATYGAALNPQCSAQWSQMMASGQDAVPCADSVESVGFGLITLSVFAILPAVAFLIFGGITLWKMAIHLFHGSWRAVFIPFATVVAIFRRRRFDVLTSLVGAAVAHYVMTVIIVFIALVGPALATGLLSEVVGEGDSAGRFSIGLLLLTAVYAALSWGLIKLTSSTGALAKMLRISSEERLEQHYGTDTPARNFGEPDKVFGLMPWSKNGSTNIKDWRNKNRAGVGQTPEQNMTDPGTPGAPGTSGTPQAPGGPVRAETAATAHPASTPADPTVLLPTTGRGPDPTNVAEFRRAADGPQAARVRSLFRQEQAAVLGGSTLRGRLPGARTSGSVPGMSGSAVVGSAPSSDRKPVFRTATAGAQAGAKVGSFVPGVGTTVAAAAGAVGGAALATTSNRKGARQQAEQAAATAQTARSTSTRTPTPARPEPAQHSRATIPPARPGEVLGGRSRPVEPQATDQNRTQGQEPPAARTEAAPTPTPAPQPAPASKPAVRPYTERRQDEMRRDEDLISGRTPRRTPTPAAESQSTVIPASSPERLSVPVHPTAFAASVPDAAHAASQDLSINDMRMVSLASGYGDFAPVSEIDPINEVTFAVVNGQNRVLPVHDPGLGR